MKLSYIAFSDKGFCLAQKLADALGGTAHRSGQNGQHSESGQPAENGEPAESGQPLTVYQWTRKQFTDADKPDGIVFVGAVGIAVRAIAPYVKDKSEDPAVVVIDECAFHVIPILSGHLGGANDLARRIASVTGSDCVITTATDVNGVFAVDEWARRQGLNLLEKERIVTISSALLAGKTVDVFSRWPVRGEIPSGIRLFAPSEEDEGMPGYAISNSSVVVDLKTLGTGALHLIPSICLLGIGCRKGTSQETIEEQLWDFLEEADVHPKAICAVATIDLKKDEPGLIAFCEEHGWPLLTYTSEELKQVPGEFTSSAFVSSITGVDNVCERSAVLASGGRLLQGKTAGNGVTMALAMKPYELNWNWKD